MHQFNSHNFIDLRQNNEGISTADSIWPSFTDIITVILMIFMLTMVFVIVKNSNLLHQLNISQAKKDAVSGKLAASLKEQENIRIKVSGMEEKLAGKEMKNILLNDEITLMKSMLTSKEETISGLNEKTLALLEKIKYLTTDIMEKEEEISDIQKKVEDFSKRYNALEHKITARDSTISLLARSQEALKLDLAKQRNEYSGLEEKYNKLFKPSRSSADKTVVTVRYSKDEEGFNYLFKDSGSTSFKKVGEKELHERLDILKKKYKKNLYVKIIIPEKSGLSYNEAWTFTRSILGRYDYYYQK